MRSHIVSAAIWTAAPSLPLFALFVYAEGRADWLSDTRTFGLFTSLALLGLLVVIPLGIFMIVQRYQAWLGARAFANIARERPPRGNV